MTNTKRCVKIGVKRKDGPQLSVNSLSPKGDNMTREKIILQRRDVYLLLLEDGTYSVESITGNISNVLFRSSDKELAKLVFNDYTKDWTGKW